MNDHIIVEFSLSLPKRSWKIRTKTRRGKRGNWVSIIGCYVFTPRAGDIIMEDDKFEWMIKNEELRDILFVLRCLSKKDYNAIKEAVYEIKPSDYINWDEERMLIKQLGYRIIVEASLRPKMWKPTELTPQLFVVFPLDKVSEVHYIVDKRGRKILKPCGHKIMAGDKLIWIILNNEWIRDIASFIARLSNDHNRKIKKEVFSMIERLEPTCNSHTFC